MSVLSPGQLLQEIRDIPFAAAATGQCARPAGDGIHIHALLKQLADIFSPRAATVAHDFIFRTITLRLYICAIATHSKLHPQTTVRI